MKNIPDWIHYDGLVAKASDQPTDHPNDPIHNAKVTSTLDHYHSTSVFVIRYTQENKLYDTMIYLEDMWEIIYSVGIKPGGKIPAPLIFVTSRGRTYPIRIGSTAYKSFLEQDNIRVIKPIPKRDLRVGGVYITLNGSRGMYLGSVNHLDPYNIHSSCIMHKPVLNTMLWLEGDVMITSPDSSAIRSDIYQWIRSTPKVWSWHPQVLNFRVAHSYRKMVEQTLNVDTRKVISEIQSTLLSLSERERGSLCHTVQLLTMTTGKPKLSPKYLRFLEKRKQSATLEKNSLKNKIV